MLILINEIKPLPRFVKIASSTLVDINTVPFEKFANIRDRKYPCYDPASTYLSFCQRIIDSKANKEGPMNKKGYDIKGNKIKKNKFDDEILEQIVKSAAFFDVLSECTDFASKFKSYIKNNANKSEQENYALFEKRAYPVFNREQLSKAQDHFEKHATSYRVSERVKIARFIEKKAQEYNVPIRSQKVLLYSKGIDNVCETQRAGRDICALGLSAKNLPPVMDQFLKNAYYTLGSQLPGNVKSLDTLFDLVETLENMNKMAQLRPGRDIEDPFDIIFNLGGKMAQTMIDLVKIDGEDYPISELLNIELPVYEEALGTDFVEEIIDVEGAIDPNRLKSEISKLNQEEQSILADFVKDRILNR